MRKFAINHENLVDIFSGAFYDSEIFKIECNVDLYNKYRYDGDCCEDVWAKIILDNKDLIVVDLEQGENHVINKASIWKGMKKVRKSYPRHYADFMECTDDFYTMDSIIQCAIFGEVIYG